MTLQHLWVQTWQAIRQIILKEFDQGTTVIVLVQDNMNTIIISLFNSVVETSEKYTSPPCSYLAQVLKTINVWDDSTNRYTEWWMYVTCWFSSSSYQFQFFMSNQKLGINPIKLQMFIAFAEHTFSVTCWENYHH